MKYLKFFISKVLFPASFFYMIFNVFAYLVEFADTDDPAKLQSFLLVLVYFIIVAFANNIFKTEIALIWKVLIHYCAIMIPLICALMFMGNDNAVGGAFLVITVAYIVIAAPVIGISAVIKKKDNEDDKYSSMFEKRK